MARRWFLLLLLLLASCKKEAPQEAIRPIKAMQIQESSTSENQILFPGTLRSFKRTNLSFRVDGIVIKRDISVGQKAKKDEVLIQLDPREYEIALRKAKGNVASIQAQLDFAERDYVRMQNIHTQDPGAISESLLDRKKETANKLQSELSVAMSEMDKAADDLSYTSLKAPYDGIITAIYVENHEQVRAKQTALRFIDTVETEMEINVPEKYINLMLAEGSRLHFKVVLDAFPAKNFPATIVEIGSEASATTKTYPVTLALKEIPTEELLLAGMTGKAILQRAPQETLSPTFKVPRAAIFTDDSGQTFVWVFDPSSQTVHKKPVELDKKNREDFALITQGVISGEWIVTAGTSFLSEGQKVKRIAEP